MPRFSVIIPCYNAASTIAETLNSVLDQTFFDFEIIIIDDGSHDETVAMVEWFAERSRRIRIVRQANEGPSIARNRGVFNYAEGELIAFLDADDIWPADRLNILDQRFSEADAPTVAYGRVAFFSGKVGDIETHSTVSDKPLKVADLIAENETCTMSNIVVAREAFVASGGFNTSIVHGEDVEWLVRMAAEGARIEGIEAVLTCYRTNRNGLSSDLSAMRFSWETAMMTARRLNVALSKGEINAAEATHLRYLARRALRLESTRGTALKLAVQALQRSPRAFFKQPRRGVLTLCAAVLEAICPDVCRRHLRNH
ncbi:glycosyltransferase family 2 protein [Martelella radicis]|uniref:Glycosyltransferase involved in cell wall biosynthesis n=1 Tax=Martelella radicis TaxID=1397476 RepID=A0A7W6KG49_9HYPH|nr:glycosyltransferase [Martelella radicis]MBB4120633.1 glycosyltransferase involved in cell wall biosynthesis [Martelella radicis]